MATSTTGLFSLPQELLDEIFSLAYPPAPDSRYYSRDDWDEHLTRQLNQSRMYDDDPIPEESKPFPELMVNQMLVSKTFFENAAQAWASNQLFTNFLRGNHCGGLFRDMSQHNSSIITKYATTIRLWQGHKHGVRAMPALRKLEVIVSQFHVARCFYDRDEQVDVCTDMLSENALHIAAVGINLNELPGVKELSILDGEAMWGLDQLLTPEEKKGWRKNLQALEDHVRKTTKGNRFVGQDVVVEEYFGCF